MNEIILTFTVLSAWFIIFMLSGFIACGKPVFKFDFSKYPDKRSIFIEPNYILCTCYDIKYIVGIAKAPHFYPFFKYTMIEMTEPKYKKYSVFRFTKLAKEIDEIYKGL